MAKFINGEHHRNPSGFINKVKYFLRESKRDPEKMKELYKNIDNDYFEIKYYWRPAYVAATLCIEHNISNPSEYLNNMHFYDEENRKTWYEKLCLK